MQNLSTATDYLKYEDYEAGDIIPLADGTVVKIAFFDEDHHDYLIFQLNGKYITLTEAVVRARFNHNLCLLVDM